MEKNSIIKCDILFCGNYSLFFGHIVLEKILKALIVKNTKEHALFTHNLVRLAEISKIKLADREVNLLKKANEFNIEARYPEQKLEFYYICTKKYTEKYITEINNLYKKVCQKLKLKK